MGSVARTDPTPDRRSGSHEQEVGIGSIVVCAMTTELEDRIDELYGLPLDRFTTERDALVKELRAAGQAPDAATVKALRKPVVSAWALNQLARQDEAGVGELIEIGQRLREAHRRAISGGDVEGLREATDERRRIVAELTGKALGIVEPGGGPSSALEDAVASTLEAASVDPDAGQLLRSGRLTKPLRPRPSCPTPDCVSSRVAARHRRPRRIASVPARWRRSSASSEARMPASVARPRRWRARRHASRISNAGGRRAGTAARRRGGAPGGRVGDQTHHRPPREAPLTFAYHLRAMPRYDPTTTEPKWVERWEAEGLYRASDEPDDPRPRFYALDMFPYPSGDLHTGHAEAFSGGDTVARFAAMRGNNVLHPIGWDAFGLPAENAAIKRGIHPKEWTYANIEQQARSFRRLGMSFDWTRRLQTCDPEYYRWTQWLFLALFERGLAYRKTAPANWCPKDATVLANEQVINGACERCGTPVVRKDLTQWFFKITDYAQRLLDDVETLVDWPERVITMQRNWIGRSEGAEVEFEIAETGDPVEVFTTRPDTLWGVTFFVFALEHPLVLSLAEAGGTVPEVRALLDRLQATPLTNREQAESREGVPLGVHAVNPVNGEKVPVFVAPYVLMEYGTGAVMGVPAHDQRDFEFARQHGLPVRVVCRRRASLGTPGSMTEAYDHEGVMVNSGPFDGVRSPESIDRVIEWLEAGGQGQPRGLVPAPRLADQPAAVLGRSDPDRPLPRAR